MHVVSQLKDPIVCVADDCEVLTTLKLLCRDLARVTARSQVHHKTHDFIWWPDCSCKRLCGVQDSWATDNYLLHADPIYLEFGRILLNNVIRRNLLMSISG
jgi:hypothetical protein